MIESNTFDILNDDFGSERPGSRKKRGKKMDDEAKKKQKESLKIRLFKIFIHLTKERNTDKLEASFMIIMMFLQIYDLMISPIMKIPFRGALYSELSSVLDVIRIYPAVLRSDNAFAYWFFMIFFLIITVAYLLLLIWVDYFLKNPKYFMVWVIRILQYMSGAIYWLLVVPATDFFISIFECDDNGFHIIDKSVVCWEGTHAFYCALYSVGIALFILVASLISLLYNEARPYHTDALTRLDTNQEIYITIYRVILTAVSHYTATQNFHWLVLALHFLMSCHFIKDYVKFLPYYYSQISILFGAGCLGYLWVTLNAIQSKALEGIEYRGEMIVVIIGLCFMYPIAHYLRENKIYKIMMLKSQDKIKNDLELDQFSVAFQSLLIEQEHDKAKEAMFLGMLFLHREECQSLSCPLKHNEQLYLPLGDSTSKRDMFPSQDKIVHQHLMNSVFLDYQKSHPNSMTCIMHHSYAVFQFFQMGNVHMTLTELNLAQKCTNTIQEAFTIFKAKVIVEDFLIKRFRASTKSGNHIIGANVPLQAYAELDVTIVITFETLFNRLEKQIEQSASDHIEFWSHLDSNMIDLNVINKLGLNIINQTKKVNEIWQQLIKINPNYPNALYIYGNYLSQIKNDGEAGDEYKNHYHQVKRLKSLDDYENQFDLMFAEDTTVIIMNGNKEQQGKIVKTNQGIFKLFGYSMFEVQGHDVNILMPPVIAIKHLGFLEKFFKTGKERIINGCLESFAMYRTGIIFPVHIVVKQLPSLKNDIQYIGMIKRSCRDYEYILTDENGKIDSISEGITSLLKLPISFFKDHDIPVQVLIPELCEVNRMKSQTGESITNFEAWNGLKDLRFMVPKNFSTSTSRGGQTSTSVKMGDATSEDVHSGTGSGTGTGTQTSSSSKNMKHLAGLLAPSQQHSFIGLKSTDSLKIISNMFKNAEHKGQPEKYKTNLLNHVNYINPDFDKILKTDIQLRTYSDGDLKVKVLKIFYTKKKKNLMGRKLSESSSLNAGGGGRDEETMLHKFGFSGMSALNDNYVFQKYKELLANSKNIDKNFNHKRLQHDIEVLKVLLDRQKKVRTHGNIMTPTEYENVELDRMKRHIEALEQQISEMNTETSKQSKQGPSINYGGQNQGTENSSLGLRNNNNTSQTFQPNGRSQGNTEDENTLNSGQRGPFPNIRDGNGGILSPAQSKKAGPMSGGAIQSISESRHNSQLSPFGASPQFKKDKDDQTNNDDKTGYDEEFDEEDSKSDLKVSSNKKKDDKQEDSGSKARKGKEDPRRDFVNDFFKQNLNPGTLTAQSPTNKKDVGSSKMRESNQPKQQFLTEWQNDILKNLQDNNRNKRDMFSKKVDSSNEKQKNKDGKDSGEAEAINTQATTSTQDKNDSSSIKVSLESDTGSVTSDTKTLIRHLRILRNALYENYLPQSIQNLKFSARFVLIVLLSMTIASFIFSKQKYDNLIENFHNIQSSQARMQSVTSINAATRMGCLINNGTLNRFRYGPSQDYLQKIKEDLNEKAQTIQQAQGNLSQTEFDFSDDNKNIINQDKVELFYNVDPDVGGSQTVNIWSSIMQLSINAFKVKDFGVTGFTLPRTVETQDFTSDISVWFILRNSMNNILDAVKDSTSGILDDTRMLADSNKQILMILLIVASACLLLSIFVIMPVVTKVHQDKDKLLSLFLLIDPIDVKDQLKRCKDFFTTFHNDDKGGSAQHVDGGFDFDDEGKEGDEDKKGDKPDGKTPSSDEVKNPEQQNKDQSHNRANRFTRKNKKLKKYSTNYIVLLLKFFVTITLLESYFLYQYFQSDNFLNRSLDMIKEAATITNRNFSNFMLYQVVMEILATNGTAKVLNQPSTEYIVDYLDSFNSELEKFLKIHQDNTDRHDDSYNNFFDSLIYKSVCNNIQNELTATDKDQCGNYLGGVLNKGLYTANLAFWDDMREIRDSFFRSNRSSSFIRQLINSDRVIAAEKLNEIYFATAYNSLIDKLNYSITVQFENRNREVVILFAFYILLLVLMYFILWGRFVESMRHSLWVTKSMLSILPLEVIEKVKVIKDFLMSTSRAAMKSLKE